MGKDKNTTEKAEAAKNEASTSVENVTPVVNENLAENKTQDKEVVPVENETSGEKTTETTETTESVENVTPVVPVLAPNQLIEVKDKPVLKASNGNVVVKGTNVSVEVSPLTAKMISKFKK